LFKGRTVNIDSEVDAPQVEVQNPAKSPQKVTPSVQKPTIIKTKATPSIKKLKQKKSNLKNVVKTKTPQKKIKSKFELDDKYVIQTETGDVVLSSVIVDDGMIIAHGDILIGHTDSIESLQDRTEPLLLASPIFWPNNTVPYNIPKNLPNEKAIHEAIKDFESNTNLSFKKRTNEKNFISFRPGKQNCYSQLGMQGGEQFISLAQGCQKGHVIHEIMHAIGFLHEQNREDRDSYIEVLWTNINEAHHDQFKKIKQPRLDLNRHPFDFSSIMIYSSTSFSIAPREGDFSMVTTNGDRFYASEFLSPSDIAKINDYYPKR